jgi:steroid delta-isomerase-like uncharacterized protein
MKRFFRPAILIAAVIFLTGNCVAQRRTYDTLAGDKKAVERLFTAWNSRDTEKVLAAFSEDAVYEDVAIDQVYRGRAQIRKWVAGTFTDFENFKLEVVRSTFYKGGGVVEWVWSGTEKGLFKTGKSFSVRGVSIIEVRGGKVSSYKEYYDFATVMRQLGLLPDKQR